MKVNIEKLSNPFFVLDSVMRRTCKIWPTKLYLSVLYYARFRKKLNWRNPLCFNEKLNWEKVYNRNPIYNLMADKYEAKKYIKSKIGEQYIVPCYGVWDKFEDIDFDKLPNQFVLKSTHDSSGVIVCKDKKSFDKEAAKEHFNNSIKRNWFPYLREWVYKDIKPRIIADMYLDDHTGTELRDYKFWCFNGVPKVIYLTNKGKVIKENFYDMDFNPLDINHGFDRMSPEFERPQMFEEMKSLAAVISKEIPFVRVDFFIVGGKVYFGECTFYDWAGMRPFETQEWDLRLGDWIDLSLVENDYKHHCLFY